MSSKLLYLIKLVIKEPIYIFSEQLRYIVQLVRLLSMDKLYNLTRFLTENNHRSVFVQNLILNKATFELAIPFVTNCTSTFILIWPPDFVKFCTSHLKCVKICF